MALVRFTLKAARRMRGGSAFGRGDSFTLPDDHPDVAALRADPAWTESKAPAAPARKGPRPATPEQANVGARAYNGLVRRVREISEVLEALDDTQRQALVVVVGGNLEQFVELVGGTFGGLISAARARRPEFAGDDEAPPELAAALARVEALEAALVDAETLREALAAELAVAHASRVELREQLAELQRVVTAARTAAPAELRIEGEVVIDKPPAAPTPDPKASLQADARSDLRVALEADPAPTRAKLVELAKLAGLPVADDLVSKTKPIVIDTLAELLSATDTPTAAELE